MKSVSVSFQILFIFLFSALICLSASAQTADFQIDENISLGPGAPKDQHVAVDAYNNVIVIPGYIPSASRQSNSSTQSITCGNFILTFEDDILSTAQGYDASTTQGAQMQATACAVFTYLSQVFQIQGSPEIYFYAAYTNTSTLTLASASPLYDNTIQSGFAPCYVQSYSQSGIDPDPAMPDAYIKTNMAITYNVNYPNSTPSNQVDLYSVLLHEGLHAMGFISLIDQNGLSKIGGPYSLLDKFIANNTGVNLINTGGTAYQTSLAAITSDQVKFNNPGGTEQHPNYSPGLYSLASSLSHLDASRTLRCAQFHYVMHPSISYGTERRKISMAELELMCDIGYTCILPPGNQNARSYPVPVSDPFAGTVNQVYNQNVVSNDLDADGDTRLINLNYPAQVISGPAGVLSTTSTNIMYTPQNNFIGSTTILYNIYDNTLSSTMIDIYNPTCLTLNYSATECPDDACNLICNGGFEDRIAPSCTVTNYTSNGFNTNMSGWHSFRGSCDILLRDPCAADPPHGGTQIYDYRIPNNAFTDYNSGIDTYSPTSVNGSPNNTYTHLFVGDYGNGTSTEGMYIHLPNTMLPGVAYTLKLRVYVKERQSYPYQFTGDLNLGFTSAVPANASSSGPPAPLTYALSANSAAHNIPTGSWQAITISFIAPANSGSLNYFVIENGFPPVATPSQVDHYVFLDDVELRQDSPKLTVVKNASTISPLPGQPFNYTITVCNTGTIAANNVVITDNFPTGIQYISGLSNYPNQNITTLAPSACQTFTVTAQVDPNLPSSLLGTFFNNCVYITSGASLCQNSTSSTNCFAIGVPASDIAVTKSCDKINVMTNDIITYTIKISNLGNFVSGGPIIVNENLPAGLTLVSYTITGNNATWNGSQVTIPGMLVNQPTILTIVAKVTATNTSAICHRIDNCAFVSSAPYPDPDLFNNSACIPIYLQGANPVIVSNSATLCNTTFKVYTLSNPGTDPGINYYWTCSSGGNVVGGQGTSIASVDWSNSCGDKTLMLLITNPFGGCTSTITYIEPGCCPCNPVSTDIVVDGNTIYDVPALYAAYPGAFTSGAPNYVYNNPGGTLYINGTFTIPASTNLLSMSFTPGSKILMATNAKIEIINSPACTLNIAGTHISSGCGGMWDGIYFGGVNKTVNVNSESLIEDAKNALVSSNGGKFTLNNAIFNKNYIGVWIKPYTGNHPGSVRQTVFTCRALPASPTILSLLGIVQSNQCQYNSLPVAGNPVATLLPPYYTGQRSYAGIYMENNGMEVLDFNTGHIVTATSVTIGSGTAFNQLNVFDNLDYGIYDSGSNLFAVNNHFQNLTGPTILTKNGGVNYGVGIYGICKTTNSTKRVIVGASGTNSFYDCSRGVDLNGFYDVTVSNNCFRSNQVYTAGLATASPIGNYAVFVKSGKYDQSDIAGNTIINWNIGIAFFSEYLTLNSGQYVRKQGKSQIRNNNISAAGAYTTAGPSEFVRVAITVEALGLSCQTCPSQSVVTDRLLIDDNRIYDAFNGIQLIGWNAFVQDPFRPRISGNEIYLKYQPNYLLTVFKQAGVRAINNFAPVVYDNQVYGDLNTGNTTSKTVLRGFYFTQNLKPYTRCNSSAETGQCFVFEGDNVGYFWDNNMYACTDGLVLLNNGKIGPQGQPVSVPYPNGLSSDNFWIGPFANSQTLTDHTFTPQLHSKLYVKSGVLTLPVNNLTVIPPGVAGIDNFLFTQSIFPVTGIAPRDCNLPAPIAPGPDDGDGKKQLMTSMIQDSIPVTGFEEESEWMSKQQVYALLLADTTLMNGEPELQQFYTSGSSAEMGKVAAADELLAQTLSASAEAVTRGMTPQLQPELNHRDVNLFYIQLQNGTPMDSMQYSQLEAIALQCPLQGGLAVYRARTLVELLDDNIRYWEDSCIIYSQARNSQPQTAYEPSPEVRLFPNPNDGTMELTYSLPDAEKGQFIVFDNTGQIVAIIPLKNGIQTQRIFLTDLAAGMYYYKVVYGSVVIKSDKLIIAR
ncbi:MAG: T9SS type A sorting domain-containing protein [Bacteroidota bacterium]|nr:T9SS type A sorting domain-containing protein [Bacteroidota bacterium]